MRRAFVVLSLVAAGCPAGDPTLTLTASTRSIDAQGQATTITVVATDAAGRVGTGTVKLSATAGALADTTLKLDAYGSAVTRFTCLAAEDPGCTGTVTLTATWPVNGATATADLKVTVGAGANGTGGPSTVTGPVAFPVSATYLYSMASTSAGIIDMEVSLTSDAPCGGNSAAPEHYVLALTFEGGGVNTLVTPGTYPAVTQNLPPPAPSCRVAYLHSTQLPDGGVLRVAFLTAQSGTVTLSSLDGDGGKSSVRAAGSYDVVLQGSDGGTTAVTGTFKLDCF